MAKMLLDILSKSWFFLTERNVTIENVIQIVEAADKSNVHDMKNYALDLIVRNFPRVAHQPQMKNLSRPLLLDILYALAK